MKKLIFSLVLLVALVCSQPLTVMAQTSVEPAGFKNVTMWVYPEYDDPRLLVMLEGQITGATSPVLIRFLVPQSAEMYSAGSKDAQGTYSGGPPDRKASQIQGWDEISYQLKTATFRVEFYYPGITGQLNKQISFDYHWLYPVADLKVIVQQPLKASAFIVYPSGQPGQENAFNVLNYSYTSLTPAQPLHFDIQYTKSDSTPSLGTPTPTPGSNAGSSSSKIPWVIIGIVGVAAVAVLSFLLVRTRMTSSQPNRSAEVSRSMKSRSKSPGTKFCNYCGKPLDPESKFCPHCGKKLAK
jgi:hypothetical protein